MAVVTAPLVIAKDAAGQDVYLYQGATVPASIPASEVERLSDYLSFPEVEEPTESIERPAESGPGSAKDKWIEFAAQEGIEIDPESDKADIIAAVTAAGK